MNIISGNLPELSYNVPLRKYFDENSPFMKKKINIYFSKSRRNVIVEKKMEKQNESGLENDNIDEDNELDLVPDIYKNEIIDYTIDPKYMKK